MTASLQAHLELLREFFLVFLEIIRMKISQETLHRITGGYRS